VANTSFTFLNHWPHICCFRMETSLAEAARKPGSVPSAGYPPEGDDHSSSATVADGVERPTRKHGRAVLCASLLGLAPGGVCRASGVTAEPGEPLPHRFTLTRLRISFGGRSTLCGTFPGVTPAGRYPAPCPAEPGLSSPRRSLGVGGQRPSGLLRPSTTINLHFTHALRKKHPVRKTEFQDSAWASCSFWRRKRSLWQWGQGTRLSALKRLLNTCGGRFMLHPRHEPLLASATATPWRLSRSLS